MKKTGNGRPEQCAANILLTIRGEVPYERLKGIDRRMIDAPSATIKPQLNEDITWVLKTYEPRINLDGIDIQAAVEKLGQYNLNANIRVKGGTA
jgi:phage baseplate assembly protein W